MALNSEWCVQRQVANPEAARLQLDEMQANAPVRMQEAYRRGALSCP